MFEKGTLRQLDAEPSYKHVELKQQVGIIITFCCSDVVHAYAIPDYPWNAAWLRQATSESQCSLFYTALAGITKC